MGAMVTLRCTKKLQKRLGTRTIQQSGASTTALGDWYGHVLFTRHVKLVVFVSEKSRLAVLLHAREFPALDARFRAAVVEVLRLLGVAEDAIHREVEAMAEVAYAPTNSRSVLGTMNDYYRSLRMQFELRPERTLTDHALHLSKTPCGPLDYDSPKNVAMSLLADWRILKFPPVLQ
jgi:hypothetical protein